MGELGHEVLAAELCGVAVDFAGGDFHQPLHHEGRLRTARAAIGVDRRGVGVNPVNFGIDGGNVVLARQQRRIEIGRYGRREGGEIGAEIGCCLHPKAQDLARLVHGQLRMGDVVAAMGVAEEGLGAVGGPFDGTAHLLGGPDADGLLRIDEDLRAEAAAHIRRHDAQFMLWRDADEGGEHQPGHMGVLAGGVEGEGFRALVIFAHGRARLHGVGCEAVVDDFQRRHMFGLGEGRVRRVLVAEMPVIDRIVGRHVMQHGRAGAGRRGGVYNGGQHAVIHDDFLRRLARDRIGVGDDDGHMVAHIAHLALGEGGMGARLHGRAVLGMDHPAANQAAHLVGGDVVAGEDCKHALHLAGGGGVNPVDRGVGVGGADEEGMGLPMTIDVVGVAALAGDEAEIFLAEDGCANACLAHHFDSLTFMAAGRAEKQRGPLGGLLRSRSHGLCASGDGLHDVVVAGAAAQIALELLADRVLVEVGSLAAHQLHGGHDHAGGAEAALQTMVLAEGGLHGVQLVALGQTLDGRDGGAVAGEGEGGAGFHGVAVHMDHAAAALAGVATHMGACHAKLFAQKLNQQGARIDLGADVLAVYRHGHGGHGHSLQRHKLE